MKIAVVGCLGKMGKRVIDVALKEGDIDIVCAVEHKKSGYIGKNLNDFFPEIKNDVKISEEISEKVDAVIDFSSPESTLKHLKESAKQKIPYVICTTGFSPEEDKKIEEYSKEIPICKSPNMALGVNYLFELAKEAASVLAKRGYDIEIFEIHHNKKKDAPSGTAKKLLEKVSQGANISIENAVYGRQGLIGARKKDEIGVMSIRCGGVVGEHTIIFANENERIEITHRAVSRDVFASGAIQAARFLVKTRKPGLYDMKDVLEI